MENATKAWIGHGVVQTNPEAYQKTIYSKDAPTNQVPGTVQEYAAFEAGPPDQIRYATFNLPTYGLVLGFIAPSRITPWVKFNTLSTHPCSKSTFYFKEVRKIIFPVLLQLLIIGLWLAGTFLNCQIL